MPIERTGILLDAIKRLIRRGDATRLRKVLSKTRAADLGVVFRSLTPREEIAVFSVMEDVEKKAMLVSELDRETTLRLIKTVPAEEIAQILEKMANDDVADLLGALPEEVANPLLDLMTHESSREIEQLLAYDSKTAGGIMVPDFIALGGETTAGEAIQALQDRYVDVEMPFYLYVVGDNGRLQGVISLRQLVVVRGETRLKSIMATDVISVQTGTDQEEVARIVARYDLLAVPVVDEKGALVGIVTVDDVIDIVRKEATEDILRMAGIGGSTEHGEDQTFVGTLRKRWPWLLASWVGGVIAWYVVAYFQDSLSRLIYLVAFMPIIMAMGGNVGTQTAASVVRALTTGRLDLGQLGRVVLQEVFVGVCLGLLYGAMLALFAQFKYGFNMWTLGTALGVSMVCAMTAAAAIASCLPLLFQRLRMDPAIATGPFVTTFTDIASVFLYFWIATLLMRP